MRTFALALLCLLASSNAEKLRGGRKLAGCQDKDSPYWQAFALKNGLDPIDGAAALYDACVNDAEIESGLKTEIIRAGCFPPTTVFMYKAFMPAANKECKSNDNCGQGGACYFKYGQSSCTPSAGAQPECGSVRLVGNPDISIVQPPVGQP